MAAHLKKRALAEFTRVIQEEKPPEPKRLRLIQKPPPSVPPVQLELHTAANSQEALQCLVAFEQRLPFDLATAENAVRGLLDHFYKEKESFVRVKVLLVLAQVVKTPGFNAAAIVDDLLNAFKREVSHTVSSQVMNTLLVIGKLQPTDRKLHGQLISVANEKLQDTSHLVRCKCLELIGALASCDSTSPAEGESDSLLQVQKMLCSYTQDQDARVRASALRALASLHERGILLDMYVYRQAGGALTDDYESVRLHAVKLLWVMAHLYPESKVTLKKSKEKIRLVDDTFVKICNMMNDLSWKVRAEAAGLLGSLHLVSPRFLEQTLDKKLMSNMRLKMSAHERQKEHFQSGEWASGNKWADDAPRGEVDEDDVSLMSGGACGAFVHGLEDEYLEVRNAAVDSLCELASHKPSFANQSLDYLVDMFNDEIESVRLNAINSLRKMCQHFSLREDQVEIITSGLLKDFNHEIRESVHNMFCSATLATTNGLRDIIFALLDNLKRYPQDRASIWKCMQHLGEHHPALSLPLIPELLSVHMYFDTPEPDMDDPAYIAVLLLVYNAAADSPTMVPLLPEHTLRHYSYLRDSLPHMVPNLQLHGHTASSDVEPPGGQSVNTQQFLKETLQRLDKVDFMDKQTGHELLAMVKQDLQRITELSPQQEATAECISMFIELKLMLEQFLGNNNFRNQSSSAQRIEKIVALTGQLEYLYLGISVRDMAMVYQIRLAAYSAKVLCMVKASHTQQSLDLCQAFTEKMAQMKKYLTEHSVTGPLLQSIIFQEEKLDIVQPQTYISAANQILQNFKCRIPRLSNQIRKAKAMITEPTGKSDNPLQFAAGLALAVDMDVLVENVEEVQELRVKLKTPEQQVQYLLPKPSDYKRIGPLKHRLVTQVLVSHAVWQEACNIELSLVKFCDRSSTDDSSESKEKVVVELCKPVKVLVQPKATKR